MALPFQAGEQVREFEGRDVHCPECEVGRWANTGPKTVARSAGLKLWREYGPTFAITLDEANPMHVR